RGDRAAILPLLDRAVSLNLDIPGLPVARASQLAGHAGVAEGRLTGRVALSGTPARPQLTGQLTLRDLSAKEKQLGAADLSVKVGGTVSKPVAEGDAHLHRGLFDVVGQGVYEDVGLDAKFSPKEVVLDRLTGTVGMGTFSAILAASRKPLPGSANLDRMEFTGEIHLGDAESVRNRKVPGTDRPLSAGPVPIRQAAEQRADVSGELDLFSDYTDSMR